VEQERERVAHRLDVARGAPEKSRIRGRSAERERGDREDRENVWRAEAAVVEDEQARRRGEEGGDHVRRPQAGAGRDLLVADEQDETADQRD